MPDRFRVTEMCQEGNVNNPSKPTSPADDCLQCGFTAVELVAVVATLSILALLVLPVLAKENDNSERATCLANMKLITSAMSMYSTDNSDALPHPTWGTDLTGADGWAYATSNRGRSPHLPQNATAQGIANCTSRAENSIQFSNQVEFFMIGQLARFVEGYRVLICPTDSRESQGIKGYAYLGRPVKVTSYCMSGSVGGYTGPKAGLLPNGRTFRTGEFLPTDIVFWEQNESDPFYFNDAGSNPEAVGQVITRRHGPANGSGASVIGRVGGSAESMNWSTFTSLQTRSSAPNDLLCGPGYR
jgi:type II secretory pathway pseudopilin PulG